MSANNNKKRLILNSVAVNLGCSSGCRRPKLSSIFHPKRPKLHHKTPTYQKHHHKNIYHSSSASSRTKSASHSTEQDNSNATTFSPDMDCTTPPPDHQYYGWDGADDMKYWSRPVRGFGRVGAGETVAVEKDSDDPYLDFRHSMLQMILEKEIYSKDDLKELLNCFLQLNSPDHHGIIVRAFTEIWNGVYSVRPSSSSSSTTTPYYSGFQEKLHYHGYKSRGF